MAIVEWGIAASCVLSILFFLIYVIGLFQLPAEGRPDTPTYDRFGRPLPPSKNPGFEETEDETH